VDARDAIQKYLETRVLRLRTVIDLVARTLADAGFKPRVAKDAT